MEPKKNGKTEVPQSRRNTMLESEHNNLQKESVMMKNFKKRAQTAVSNARNFAARKAGWMLLVIAPVIFAASCEKPKTCDVELDLLNKAKKTEAYAAQASRNGLKKATTTPTNIESGFWNRFGELRDGYGISVVDLNDTIRVVEMVFAEAKNPDGTYIANTDATIECLGLFNEYKTAQVATQTAQQNHTACEMSN
jgi:hypothetical protein